MSALFITPRDPRHRHAILFALLIAAACLAAVGRLA